MSIACYLLVIQSALCCTCVFFDCNKSHISGMYWCYKTGFSTRVPQTGCLPTLFVFVTKVDVWVLLNRVQLQTFVRCMCECVCMCVRKWHSCSFMTVNEASIVDTAYDEPLQLLALLQWRCCGRLWSSPSLFTSMASSYAILCMLHYYIALELLLLPTVWINGSTNSWLMATLQTSAVPS